MDTIYKVVWSVNSAVYDSVTTLFGASSATYTIDQEIAQRAIRTADSAVNEMKNMVRAGHPILRIAGISGALAVALGAYGAHAFYSKDQVAGDLKVVFETANRYHFLHTIALLAVPLCRRPMLTGSLIGLGTLIFSGSCYYYALSEERWIRKITPYGGTLLILGWLSMAL